MHLFANKLKVCCIKFSLAKVNNIIYTDVDFFTVAKGMHRHLGHPRVTVACQSDWALFTLGLNNSSQFCSRPLFPQLSILPLRR
jgi:hypothetical protein